MRKCGGMSRLLDVVCEIDHALLEERCEAKVGELLKARSEGKKQEAEAAEGQGHSGEDAGEEPTAVGPYRLLA